MKKIFDVIFSDLTSGRQQLNESQRKGAQSFYQSKKIGKEIIEPKSFHSTSFSQYDQQENFSALSQYINQGHYQDAMAVLEKNALSGCGGANFPAVKKWRAVAANKGPRYLIVNGMEGELYTFKDYMLMKLYPHALVEGAAIAALCIDASEVIFAINSTYKQCIANVKQAIADLLTHKPELNKIHFEVVEGPNPDLYIIGEETALLEFLENRRGEPQLKPPYPFQQGYKNKPTLIQNVETLSWVPLLLSKPTSFLDQGQLKLLSINGAVNQPGIYEVSIGTPLNEILSLAGGLIDGSQLQAIEVGGLAGGLLPPQYLNKNLDYEEMKNMGAMIGTGSINFLDQNTCLIDTVLRAMEFFRDESCGRCTPCRVGTHELLRAADLLTERELDDDELKWLEDVSQTMKVSSTCGLGKGAPSILLSLLRYWKVENGKTGLNIDPVFSEALPPLSVHKNA